jgi:anti-sigma regulatory factor (Ser/Thr protein kinase)
LLYSDGTGGAGEPDLAMTGGGSEGTYVLMSEPGNLGRLREWLRGEFTRHNVRAADQFGLQVAVGEICANSIRHAYAGVAGQPIHVSVRGHPDRLVIEVRDFGKKFDPSAYRAPDLEALPEGGIGLHLVKQYVDEFSYDVTLDAGTRWTLVKYLPAGRPGSGTP